MVIWNKRPRYLPKTGFVHELFDVPIGVGQIVNGVGIIQKGITVAYDSTKPKLEGQAELAVPVVVKLV